MTEQERQEVIAAMVAKLQLLPDEALAAFERMLDKIEAQAQVTQIINNGQMAKIDNLLQAQVA